MSTATLPSPTPSPSSERRRMIEEEAPSLRLIYVMECEKLWRHIKVNKTLAMQLPKLDSDADLLAHERPKLYENEEMVPGEQWPPRAAVSRSPLRTHNNKGISSSSASCGGSTSGHRYTVKTTPRRGEEEELPVKNDFGNTIQEEGYPSTSDSSPCSSWHLSPLFRRPQVDEEAMVAAASPTVSPNFRRRRMMLAADGGGGGGGGGEEDAVNHDGHINNKKELSTSRAAPSSSSSLLLLSPAASSPSSSSSLSTVAASPPPPHSPPLTTIDCTLYYLGDHGFKPLAAILKRPQVAASLERLLLGHCGLTAASMPLLIECVSPMKKLGELDLSHNNISQEGGKLLHRFIVKQRTSMASATTTSSSGVISTTTTTATRVKVQGCTDINAALIKMIEDPDTHRGHFRPPSMTDTMREAVEQKRKAEREANLRQLEADIAAQMETEEAPPRARIAREELVFFSDEIEGPFVMERESLQVHHQERKVKIQVEASNWMKEQMEQAKRQAELRRKEQQEEEARKKKQEESKCVVQ